MAGKPRSTYCDITVCHTEKKDELGETRLTPFPDNAFF